MNDVQVGQVSFLRKGYHDAFRERWPGKSAAKDGNGHSHHDGHHYGHHARRRNSDSGDAKPLNQADLLV